ncbi:MAG: tetratricopeptide repeat protein [Bacteroidia bacterium]|nr:tetratricopeptide repeat protein [Bacteroidia bacterium]
MAKLMNGIGWAYMELDLDKEAINWFRKAVQVTDNIQYTKHFGRIYSNMASAYNSLKLYDSAEACVNKAIELNHAEQNVESLANALNIKADIYLHTGRKTQVEAVLTEALELRKKKGDPFYIVSDMFQLATYYAENGQPEKGIAVSLEGIEIAKKFNIASKLPVLMNALAENYKVAGNFKMHSETMEKLLVLKDSLYAANTAQALADIQGKYDLQKKENVIIRQQLELTKKDYLFYGSMLLLALALLIVWLIFRNYKRKQRMKMEMALAEEKRETDKAIAEAEEKERRRIAADLHDNLGAYAASIAANVDHISLQQSGHESNFSLQELRNNSQAIVSQLSDTIWALKKDALSLTAISDRLKIFIQRIQPGYPHISIDVTEDIETDFLLPPSQAFHLFRIMQEAINNAVRHSGCSNVSVLIESTGQWKICIKDNGKGIAESNISKTGGNGIGNMKSRAHDAGWKIEWLRNGAGGTNVAIGPATIN